ncbi:MAG: ferritin family protein [Deltaproteobacteria bacterium]|nr:ferritin family protein [Deltaproteobacteria bacterium]
MDDAIKEMTEGLRQAMLAERTGFEFYTLAAKTTQDPDGKATFEQLAREEQEHFEFLSTHYKSLVSKGTLAEGVTLSDRKHTQADAAIFSKSLRERIKGAHFEMSALAIAVQLELNGIKHYSEQAKKASLPAARKFFEDLVAWESGHYDALIRQQQMLQEDYWRENGFDPF